MEGDLSKMPWGQPYSVTKTVKNWRYNYNHTYKADFQLIEDRHYLSYWCRGDIIKLSSGYFGPPTQPWRKWFQPKEDYLQYLHDNRRRDKRIPLYARSEYAMILSRYKWTKHKYQIFRDYGTIFMMLTGSKIGHIRKMFASSPFTIFSEFPYGKPGSYVDTMLSRLPQHKEIRKIIRYVNTKVDNLNSQMAKNIFVEEMFHAFGEE